MTQKQTPNTPFQISGLFRSVYKDFGGVDGLTNNAGITSDALLVKATGGKVQTKMSLTDFHKVLAVDLRGVSLARARRPSTWSRAPAAAS